MGSWAPGLSAAAQGLTGSAPMAPAGGGGTFRHRGAFRVPRVVALPLLIMAASPPRKCGGEVERTGGIRPGTGGLGRLPPSLSLWACADGRRVGGEAWETGGSSGQRTWLHSPVLSVTGLNGAPAPLDVGFLGGQVGLVYPCARPYYSLSQNGHLLREPFEVKCHLVCSDTGSNHPCLPAATRPHP